MRTPTLALIFVAVSLVARADDTRPLLSLTAHGIFGDELLHGPSTSELVVEVASRAARPIRGEVEVTVDPYVYGGPETSYVARLHLPPHARRRAIVPIFVPRRGTTFRIRYIEDGRVLARSNMSTGYDDMARGVAILANPARLRAGLLDLRVDAAVPGRGSGAAVSLLAPVGVVSYEPRTGEALLPRTPEGYGALALLIATAAELERLDEVAVATLRAHVEAGGRLLVVPRDPGELVGPHVGALFGPLRLEPSTESVEATSFVPEGLPAETLLGPLVTSRGFGAERRIGFGRAAILRYDANLEPHDRSPALRELVRGLVEDANRPDGDGPLFPLGRGQEGWTRYDGYGGTAELAPLLPLRQALDPNEAFEGAILVVGCLLVAYVIVVGPLTFAFVRHRNRPMLVLTIAPALAFAGLAALVMVGFVGKGVSSRHRTVTLLEATEGSARALERSYTGLFFTRPGVVTLAPSAGTLARPVGNDEPSGGRVDVTELPPRLANLRGNVWDTRVVRIDGVRDLGGAVRFEGTTKALVAVLNQSRETLHDAVLVSDDGRVRRLGTLAPGARARVAEAVVTRLDQSGGLDSLRQGRTRILAEHLAVPRRSRDLLEGLFAATRAVLVRPDQVVLLARLEGRERTLAGRFSEDRSLVLLRVVSRPELRTLTVSSEAGLVEEASP